MDPKVPQPLDPKLQEAYDRVMGVAVDPAPSITGTPDPIIQEQPIPSASASTTQPLSETMQAPGLPIIPSLPLTEEVTKTPQPLMVPGAPSGKTHAFVAKSGGRKMSPIIWVAGGVVFLIIYTIVCFKLFNVPIPFISQ